MTRTWSLLQVRPMEGEREQFAHVVKHLYSPEERWDQIVPDLGDPRARASLAKCTKRDLRGTYPSCYSAEEACRAHVIGDHDRLYAPAYHDALRDAEETGRFGRSKPSGHGPSWSFVDSRGVYVIVAEYRCMAPKVRTAYRPTTTLHSPSSADDFFKLAVRKLKDKSSWKGGGR